MDPEKISAELEALRGEVERLRAALVERERPGGINMREHSRCPHCGGRSLLHLSEVRDQNYGDAHTPMAIQASGVFRRKYVGTYELYACRQCERVEWYLRGAGEVDPEELDKANRKTVRIVEGEVREEGPFR